MNEEYMPQEIKWTEHLTSSQPVVSYVRCSSS